MILSLPPKLETAIENALKDLPSSQWVSVAQDLSERYRAEQRGGHVKPVKAPVLATGKKAALGYVALILPATYAQLRGAMAATSPRIPNWQPRTLLDIGSGPGTALWAAIQQWPTLENLTAWERETAFIELGQALVQDSDNAALQNTKWERIHLENILPIDNRQYDLIVLGHVLNELEADLRKRVVSYAWEHCTGVLLLVEPGTSAAFPVVKEARQQLVDVGAETIAPCAHNGECLLTGDWCHFPQKINRPGFQRRAKNATAGWEESKFSYAAMARFAPEKPIWGRLIHQPYLHKAYAELTISSRDGINKHRVPKRDKAAYNEAKDLAWGDTLNEPRS